MSKTSVDKLTVNGKVWCSVEFLTRKHKCSSSYISKKATALGLEKMVISGANYYLDDPRFALKAPEPKEVNGDGKFVPKPAPTYVALAHKIERILHIQEQMEETLNRIEEHLTNPNGSNNLKESDADSE